MLRIILREPTEPSLIAEATYLGVKGKNVIVTGGGSNIGRAIVRGFAEVGSNIVIAELVPS